MGCRTAVVFAGDPSLVVNLSEKLETWRSCALTKVDPLVVESARRIDASITEKQLVARWQWVRARNGNAGNLPAAQGAREAKAELNAPPTLRTAARSPRAQGSARPRGPTKAPLPRHLRPHRRRPPFESGNRFSRK